MILCSPFPLTPPSTAADGDRVRCLVVVNKELD